MPATFTTAPFGASEPLQHRDAADRVDRVGQRVDHLAVGRRRIEVGQVLGHGLAGDREAVAVEQAGLEQVAHARSGTPPTRSMSTMWYLPCGLVSAMCGTRAATLLKSSSAELDAGLGGDGEQVQHRVGGAAEGHRRRRWRSRTPPWS